MSSTPPGMVKVYDPETKTVTLMPACELSAGMVRIRITGQPDEVWADAAKLNATSVHRQPPFTGELAAKIRYIERSLREVYPKTYEDWEDGFRCDLYAEDEINSWVHLCRCLNDFIAIHLSPREERQQAFDVLAACLIGTPETAPAICRSKLPDPRKVDELMHAFYHGFGPST